MRILHTPLNIANDAWSMSRAERRLGHESTLAVVQQNPYAEVADLDLGFASHHPVIRPVARRVRKVRFAVSSGWRYDLIVYEFATSIIDFRRYGLDLLDMRLASRAPAITAAVFHGCDVRSATPGQCGFCPYGCDSEQVARRLGIIRRVAQLLYVKTPDLLRVVPEAVWLPQAVLDIDHVTPALPATGGPLRIVHAPSDRAIKGTSYVVEAVEQLRAEGVEIELLLVEGVKHREAIEAYRRADLAIDQLLVGWYGVFAIELMAMGKPVVCFIDPRNLELAGLTQLPVINASPADLYDVLRHAASNRTWLLEAGKRAAEYVRVAHDAERLAARLLADVDRLRVSAGELL